MDSALSLRQYIVMQLGCVGARTAMLRGMVGCVLVLCGGIQGLNCIAFHYKNAQYLLHIICTPN